MIFDLVTFFAKATVTEGFEMVAGLRRSEREDKVKGRLRSSYSHREAKGRCKEFSCNQRECDRSLPEFVWLWEKTPDNGDGGKKVKVIAKAKSKSKSN